MDIQAKCWQLQWGVQRSVRYHARREAFFDRWRLVTSGAGVFFGSAAAVNLVAEGGVALTLAAALVVTALSSIDLVVGTSTMARRHGELRRRFLNMETDILCTPEATAEDLARWIRERREIEADEPPVYVALDLLCENELARAMGLPLRARLSRWNRLTAHWLRQENIDPHPPAPADPQPAP